MTRPNVWLALLKQNWQFLSKFLVPLFLCELQIKAGKPFSLFCFFLMILNFREKNSLMLSFKNSNEFFKIAALFGEIANYIHNDQNSYNKILELLRDT